LEGKNRIYPKERYNEQKEIKKARLEINCSLGMSAKREKTTTYS
jgi:hypothetical protein